MKTFFKTLSAAALALILAACGGQKDSAPAASASAAADNGAEKKEIVFGTTVGDFGDMVKEHIQPELEKKATPSNWSSLPTMCARIGIG